MAGTYLLSVSATFLTLIYFSYLLYVLDLIVFGGFNCAIGPSVDSQVLESIQRSFSPTLFGL